VIDSSLPKPIARTLYSRVGDWPVGVMMTAALLMVRRRRTLADLKTG
jgi:hypothetical protein